MSGPMNLLNGLKHRSTWQVLAVYLGVELWADADPELQSRVEAARTRLAEIIRERG